MTDHDLEALKESIKEAEREVDIAERHLKNKQLAVQFLQSQLQDLIIAGVQGLKVSTGERGPLTSSQPSEPEDEAARRARVRRRWRVLGMKIKFGLGAQAMSVKRRNTKDASSFIDNETEEATKEDQLDLEGKCGRKTKDRRYFRKGGVLVGVTQGRDNF